MLCQSCNERNATVHVTTLVNGETHEAHYCEECDPPFPPPGMPRHFTLDLNPVGKACLFCGAPAVKTPMRAMLATFCCQDCSDVFERHFAELENENPQPSNPGEIFDWIQRNSGEVIRRMQGELIKSPEPRQNCFGIWKDSSLLSRGARTDCAEHLRAQLQFVRSKPGIFAVPTRRTTGF